MHQGSSFKKDSSDGRKAFRLSKPKDPNSPRKQSPKVIPERAPQRVAQKKVQVVPLTFAKAKCEAEGYAWAIALYAVDTYIN